MDQNLVVLEEGFTTTDDEAVGPVVAFGADVFYLRVFLVDDPGDPTTRCSAR